MSPRTFPLCHVKHAHYYLRARAKKIMADVLDVDVEDKGGFSDDDGDGKVMFTKRALTYLLDSFLHNTGSTRFVSSFRCLCFVSEGIQRLKSAVTKRKGRGFRGTRLCL